MADRMASITIRLLPSHVRALKARAKARGLRPAPYLRGLVVDLLEGAENEDTRRTLEALTQSAFDLRHRLAKATAAILTDLQTTTKVNKKSVLTPDEINDWVGNNILK